MSDTPSSEHAADPASIERLLRLLDGNLAPEEQAEVSAWLSRDASARRLLRDLAEQAVGLAEIAHQEDATTETPRPPQHPLPVTARRRPLMARWQSVAITLVASIVVTASGYSAWTLGRLPPARVARAVGPTRLFSASGRTVDGIPEGHRLQPGDTLESLSSDAWITTDLVGGQLTTAGDSVVRVLRPAGNERRFALVQGSLWIDPTADNRLGDVVVQTPTAEVGAAGSLFDVRTSATDSLIRVHRGRVTVRRRVDDASVTIAAGEQARISLDASGPPTALPQPPSTNRWALDLPSAANVSHGVVVPAMADLPARIYQWALDLTSGGDSQTSRGGSTTSDLPPRLYAIPLLWKENVETPVLLHVAAVAAWMTTDSPVQIEAGSRVLFRGEMEHRSGLRLGFTTQRMQGVFAGKFEVDVSADDLTWNGSRWEISLGIDQFEAMNPQLASTPVDQELGDIYVVLLDGTAKLSLTAIEIGPGSSPR